MSSTTTATAPEVTLNLCERHRIVTMVYARKNGKTRIMEYVRANPDACPYCLLWTDARKRKK